MAVVFFCSFLPVFIFYLNSHNVVHKSLPLAVSTLPLVVSTLPLVVSRQKSYLQWNVKSLPVHYAEALKLVLYVWRKSFLSAQVFSSKVFFLLSGKTLWKGLETLMFVIMYVRNSNCVSLGKQQHNGLQWRRNVWLVGCRGENHYVTLLCKQRRPRCTASTSLREREARHASCVPKAIRAFCKLSSDWLNMQHT